MHRVQELLHLVDVRLACVFELIMFLGHALDRVFFFIVVLAIGQIHLVKEDFDDFDELLVAQLEILVGGGHLEV
jgi:hypothetical protein